MLNNLLKSVSLVITFATTALSAGITDGKVDYCCHGTNYGLASDAKALADYLANDRVSGKHHWYQNGGIIVETNGEAVKGSSISGLLKELISRCTTDDGISVSGRTCSHDVTDNDICLYREPAAGCDSTCINAGGWNSSRCPIGMTKVDENGKPTAN